MANFCGRTYIKERGMETIRMHARQIVQQRLADAQPKNDGKQTPMRGAPKGHPVFIGQHATGTCCRGCLEKTCRGCADGMDRAANERVAWQINIK